MANGFWTRAGGVGGIVFFVSLGVLIALMPLSYYVSEPAFDASSGAFLAYAKSESNLPFALELVGVLGLFGFVVFGAVLADRVRVEGERSNIPSTLVLLATIVFSVLWLAELGISFAERFRQQDLDPTGASILFGVANGLFVISWAAIGGFLLTAGIASLWSRALPSLLGWAALVIGIGMVLSLAAPLTALWLFAYLLFFLWVIVTSVLFFRVTSSQDRVEASSLGKEHGTMPNETLPAERVHGSVSTDGLRLGGALWVIAGVICAGLLIFVFVGENLLAQNPGLSAMVLGGAVAALLTGGLLLARPGLGVVRWSTVVGLAWLLAFGSLMLTALNGPERGPMLSSGLITGFGVAGALVTFRAGRPGR